MTPRGCARCAFGMRAAHFLKGLLKSGPQSPYLRPEPPSAILSVPSPRVLSALVAAWSSSDGNCIPHRERAYPCRWRLAALPAAGPGTWRHLDDLHAQQPAAWMTTAWPPSGARRPTPHLSQRRQVQAAWMSCMPSSPLSCRWCTRRHHRAPAGGRGGAPLSSMPWATLPLAYRPLRAEAGTVALDATAPHCPPRAEDGAASMACTPSIRRGGRRRARCHLPPAASRGERRRAGRPGPRTASTSPAAGQGQRPCTGCRRPSTGRRAGWWAPPR